MGDLCIILTTTFHAENSSCSSLHLQEEFAFGGGTVYLCLFVPFSACPYYPRCHAPPTCATFFQCLPFPSYYILPFPFHSCSGAEGRLGGGGGCSAVSTIWRCLTRWGWRLTSHLVSAPCSTPRSFHPTLPHMPHHLHVAVRLPIPSVATTCDSIHYTPTFIHLIRSYLADGELLLLPGGGWKMVPSLWKGGSILEGIQSLLLCLILTSPLTPFPLPLLLIPKLRRSD